MTALLIECCYAPFAELTTELEGKKPDKDVKAIYRNTGIQNSDDP